MNKASEMIQKGRCGYFIGIGGMGMSALAQVCASKGIRVFGSDQQLGAISKKFEEVKISVQIGHSGYFAERPDFIVYSSAISATNPDILEARRLGIPMYHRAEALAAVIGNDTLISVLGAHGKSTSSALASFLLWESGFEPTCLVGAHMLNFGNNAVIGQPDLFVAEIDESDRSHLQFSPIFALITNLDAEHLDVYQGLDDLKTTFGLFAGKVKQAGKIIYCLDDPNLTEVMAPYGEQTVSYGFQKEADFWATEPEFEGLESSFTFFERGVRVGEVKLSIPGLHNISNALGVIALIRSYGVPYERFLHRMAAFQGVGRRLQVKWSEPELLIIDDYAHHPTEIRASLSAIKGLRKKTTVVFQPHRYSRTEMLAREFSEAFDDADKVFLTDIYGASEINSRQVSSALIYDLVQNRGSKRMQLVPKQDIISTLESSLTESETVLFMGAGDIGAIANAFAARHEKVPSHEC